MSGDGAAQEDAKMKFEGSKYAAGTNIATIAKMVRADIKGAVASGALPKAKYSVTIQRYSGGQSLRVSVSEVVIPNASCLKLYTEEYLRSTVETPKVFVRHDRFTAPAIAVLDTVRDIVSAYNFDDSDSMTDYFHVNFYTNIDFDSSWETTIREAQLARLYPSKVA